MRTLKSSMSLANFRKGLITGLTSGAAGSVSLLLGVLLFAREEWPLFALASVAFAVFLAFLSLPARTLLQGLRMPRRALGAALIGVPAGYFWMAAFLTFLGVLPLEALGPVFGFPLLYFAMAGAVVGILASSSIEESALRARDELSRRPSTWKTIGLLLVVPFAYLASAILVVLSLSAFLDRSQPEVYLIPEGYVGRVLIVYGQPNGRPFEYDGEARLFRIPENGVLLVQPARMDGSATEFWYVDQQLRRTLPIVWNQGCTKDLPGDPVVACLRGLVMFWGGKQLPEHQIFTIGRESQQSEIASAYEGTLNYLLSLVP